MGIAETILEMKHRALGAGGRPTTVSMHPYLAQQLTEDLHLQVNPEEVYVT